MKHEDEVSSAWLVRGLDGKEYKPEDYLVAFARFVKENPAQVEAIGILLDRPQDGAPRRLENCDRNSAATTERFTVDNLQKAHKVRYRQSPRRYHLDGQTRGS